MENLLEQLAWFPQRTADARQLDAARTHALAEGVTLINGSWNARTPTGRLPALLIDVQRRPALAAWLAQREPASALAELALLDAPSGAIMLLLVQAGQLPVFWLSFRLEEANERAMAAVLMREQRVGISTGPDVRGVRVTGAVMPISGMHLPDQDRLRRLMPEAVLPAAGTQPILPPMVARAITIPAHQSPIRAIFLDTPRLRVVSYTSAETVRLLQNGTSINVLQRTAIYQTVTATIEGSLEAAHIGAGWRCIRLVYLHPTTPCAATVASEVILAYRDDPGQLWSRLARELPTASRALVPTVLILLWFLARTAPLSEDARIIWLPACDALIQELPGLVRTLDLGDLQPASLIELEHLAAAVWSDSPDLALLTHALAGEANMGILAAAGRWGAAAPQAHAHAAAASFAVLASAAGLQQIARSGAAQPPSAAARRWIEASWASVWICPSAGAPLSPEAARVAQEAVSVLCHAIGGRLSAVGSFGTDVPLAYQELHALGIAEVWCDVASERLVWLRLIPEGGEGGLVLFWQPAEHRPAAWHLVLPERAATELHLLLLAIFRDFAQAGIDRVLIQAPVAVPENQDSHLQQRQRGRRIVELPRGRTERVLLGHVARPARHGQYVRAEERQAIERQVAELHRVRAHFVRFAPGTRRARAEVVDLWNQISDVEKLLHFRTTELPPDATIRGLRQHADGSLSFGYQRGHADPTRTPTAIVAQGALLVAGVLKIIHDESPGKEVFPI